MCNSDHYIKLHFAVNHEITLGGVIEATGLFINAFVEGDVLHDRTYVLSIESVSAKDFIIRVTLRHPLEVGNFALERAYAPMYLLVAAWFLAGSNVEIEGPWKESFPCQGTLVHPTTIPLELRPLFQDGLPASERTAYPSLETLAEIHSAIGHGAKWQELRENAAFQSCFPEVSPNVEAPNNIRLHHHSGLWVDLILKQGFIASHIMNGVQVDYDAGFITCGSQVAVVRTWWDAWINHCPTTDLTPKRLMSLPDELAIFSTSGSIWRYRLKNMTTVERPLEIDFGDGVEPARSIEFWLQIANRFGEAGFVDIAIACCEQAIASANALIANTPGLSFKLPIGVSPREQLNDAETEYCRWLDYKESLNRPKVPHDRWSDKVTSKGLHELMHRVGTQWEPTLESLVEAINQQHYDAHDYHKTIGRVCEFFCDVNGEIGKLKYSRLFGQELMDAKVPKRALALLGYGFLEEVIPGYVEFSDIFTLTLGNEVFWGSVEKRVLISRSDPSLAFHV